MKLEVFTSFCKTVQIGYIFFSVAPIFNDGFYTENYYESQITKVDLRVDFSG